jgi:hypothetical protein
MPIKYYDLGKQLQLNQIVMVGSHDAGITEGGKNAKTQTKSIYEQAVCGVRMFDTRVAMFDTGEVKGDKPKVKMTTFHAPEQPVLMSHSTKSVYEKHKHTSEETEVTTIRAGVQGESLKRVLKDSRKFVEDYPTEFILLKFDHCYNWESIAFYCQKYLISPTHNYLYTGSGDLNKLTLEEMQGKVFVLFQESGFQKLTEQYTQDASGINKIKNLYKSGPSTPYDPNFRGLQYFGKGGTSLLKAFGKPEQNFKKQGKIARKFTECDPRVMGMLYWTSTGMLESIENRNDKMWEGTNLEKLKELYSYGFYDSILSKVPHNVNTTSHSAAALLSAAVPNIIMIDFVDDDKCSTIYNLNKLPSDKLVQLAKVDEKRKEERKEAIIEGIKQGGMMAAQSISRSLPFGS